MQRLNGLRLARLMRGKAQEEVSLGTRIPQPVISQYEQGYRKPKDEHLKALLRFYGVTLDGLNQLEEVLKRI